MVMFSFPSLNLGSFSHLGSSAKRRQRHSLLAEQGLIKLLILLLSYSVDHIGRVPDPGVALVRGRNHVECDYPNGKTCVAVSYR